MDAHGVDVFHVADGDAVVGGIAHHLVFQLFPALQVYLYEHLIDGAGGNAARSYGGELIPGAGDASTRPPEGVGGPYDQGQSKPLSHSQGFFYSLNGGAGRGRLPDVAQELLEELPILRLADGVEGRAQHANVELFQDSGLGELDGEVKASLPAEGREDAVGALLLDYPGDDLKGQGFDVYDVGDVLVGHDGGWVGVDQHGGDALFAEGLAGLGAGVVELGGLAYDDGAGANYEDFGGFVGHSNGAP